MMHLLQRLLATGGLIVAPVALLATPALGQARCAAAPAKPKTKLGLSGLLAKARGSGLLGSVMGAARSDGGLKGDLAAVALSAATDAAGTMAGCEKDPAVEPRAMHDGVPVSAKREGSVKPVSYSYPSDLPDPAGFAAIKDAYMAFGKDDCPSCEGGFAYDGWPAFPRDEFSSKYNGDAQRIGAWPVGHVHRWKGNVSTGTLTVVSEETVEGFRCRRLTYRLTKGQSSAERPGLLCWGRANQFAGKESWNQVY